MRMPGGTTDYYFILAHPVAHVRAAEFINPVFERMGLDAFLIPIHVLPDDLEDVVPRLAKLQNLKGLIVTIPHKEAIAKLCHELGPHAKLVGAVNTVRIGPDGHLAGEIFDGVGLVRGMRANRLDLSGERILMVGAGGAGRAIAFSFAQEGVSKLTVANRTASRGKSLVGDLRAAFPDLSVAFGRADPAGHDIILNATSLGLHEGDPLPVSAEALERDQVVVDIIAARDETELMAAARAKGCVVMGGRPMVDEQIAAQVAFIRGEA